MAEANTAGRWRRMGNQAARSLFFRLCSKLEVGSLELTLPDGSTRLFEGAHAPHIRAQMTVHDPDFFSTLLSQGDWGLGWGFVERRWDSKDPCAIARLVMLNEEVFRPAVSAGQMLSGPMRQVSKRLRHNQSTEADVRKRTVGECYDVGNDFFRWALGPSMVYTCAIWPRPDATLEEAQENKLRIVTEKARIEPHHRVADLGCGFGTLAGYIQRTTGAQVKGITLSRNQLEWAKEHHPGCEFEYLDYAELEGEFDRIVSVGMAEHVGRPNLTAFLRQVAGHLAPGGRFVMHTMLSREGVLMRSSKQRWDSFGSVAMPNGDVPAMSDIVRAAMRTGELRIIHTEGFGIHYARTGQEWLKNTIAHRDEIVDAYSEDLYRTYQYTWGLGSAMMETGMTLAHVVFEKKPYGAPLEDSIL